MSGIRNTPRSCRISSASGVVGPLAASATILALMRVRVVLRDLVLERGRHQDLAVELQDLGVADLIGTREADDRAVLLLPGADLGRVEALRVVDAAARVADRDDPRSPRPRAASAAMRAGVAVALDRDAGAGERDVQRLRLAWCSVKTAPRAVASLRPSEPPIAIGLPVTTPGIV